LFEPTSEGETVQFELERLSAEEKYKLLTATVVPRPIAWVVSRNIEGRLNCAPFSFFNAFSGEPPVVCIGIGSRTGNPKDTASNIQRTGEFVVNLVPETLVKTMNITAIDFGPEVNELDEAAVETVPGTKVNVPRIAASPVAFECQRMVGLEIGAGRTIVVGRIVAMYVADDAVIDASKCYINTPKLHLVGRMHGAGWYSRTDDQFQVPRIGEKEWWAAHPDEE
jgi:flavin reductase (DIM6/NTAB) family NADH-FMN oxidoreductase RutF